MSEQVGGIGKSLTKALSGVLIIYLAVIGITVLLIGISAGYKELFPSVINPFPMLYNTIRNFTLFILVFPFAIGVLGGAFAIDVVTAIIFGLGNAILPDVFVTSVGTDFMTDAQGLVTTIKGLAETLFPLIPYD